MQLIFPKVYCQNC